MRLPIPPGLIEIASDLQPSGALICSHTHPSRTDPEATRSRTTAGQEAKLAHRDHALSENRNGLILGVGATEANGTAERSTALGMVDELRSKHGRTPKTLGADKGYDCGEFSGLWKKGGSNRMCRW